MRFALRFKRRLSRKEWNLLIICIIIIMIMLVEVGLRQTYLRFSRLREEVSLRESEFIRLNRILRQKDEIDSGYREAVFGLQQIKSSDDFLEEIEGLVGRVGLNIRNIKPMAAKDEDLYKVYSVRIEAQDDISALGNFLHAFIEERKAIGVGRLEINAQSRKELPRMSIMISAMGSKD